MFQRIILYLVIAPIALLGALFTFGTLVENVTEHKTQHERCLQRATNGYEIARCR